MEKTATVKAKDLAPATRAWIMQILHVDLADEDEFTVSLHRPVQSPSPDQRAAARQRLFEVLHRFDQRTNDIPDQEMDAAINEAMRSVHPRND